MPRGWPLLRRAPSRMLHNGPIGAMILTSVALLAGLVAAGPLFGWATGAGGLARRLGHHSADHGGEPASRGAGDGAQRPTSRV